jgi:hypothetical protein
VIVTGYTRANRSYLAVSDAGDVMRDLSPWVERVSPLGRRVDGLDVTGLNDTGVRTVAGSEAAQEFNIAGRWDDAPLIGPDAVLADIVGRNVTVDYGPSGHATGQRRITGHFVCLSYRVGSAAGEPVRFEAVFRQDGNITLWVW